MTLGTILIIVVIIYLLGGFSGRFGGYGYGLGHSGMGICGVVLVVLIVLLLFDVHNLLMLNAYLRLGDRQAGIHHQAVQESHFRQTILSSGRRSALRPKRHPHVVREPGVSAAAPSARAGARPCQREGRRRRGVTPGIKASMPSGQRPRAYLFGSQWVRK